MTDRVYPSTKPQPPPAATNGGTAAATTNGGVPPTKPQIYRPYQPQPSRNRHRSRRCRCTCCCCLFWTILLFLIFSLLIIIAGAALYVLYRPHRPAFSLSSLHTKTLNLTTSSDSISHLVTHFNLTLLSKNPNNHLTFYYDPFVFTFETVQDSVFLGNGSFPGFTSNVKNQTLLRTTVKTNTQDLDSDSVQTLRSEMSKKNGVPLKIQLDTKMKVKAGNVKTKKFGIRVTCDGIKGVTVPKGNSSSTASVSDSKCKVDLRIKIWRFTF